MADSEPLQKRHKRSVSAGGVSVSVLPPQRPSALRKSHERAFSHGQIDAEVRFIKDPALNSSTELILPSGQREGYIRSGHARQPSGTESVYTVREDLPPSYLDLLIAFLLRKKNKCALERRIRTIVPNHTLPPKSRANPGCNEIRTTKYTLLNFIVKNLFEQLRRIANLYFIFIVLLNWVPSINAFGKEIAVLPVVFVLGVTAIKDLFEDHQRHSSDKRINNSTCRVYSGEEDRYKKITWKELRVGDIVHLSNNEVVPADVLLLRTSDEYGTCYLDTCNLDGESSLKLRNVPQGLANSGMHFEPKNFRSFVEAQPPTTNLYEFSGGIVDPCTGGRIFCSTDHLVLRDSVIKNTDFVEGIVIYVGHETKAMLNNSGPRHKLSSLESQMNTDVLWCIAILIILCIFGAIGAKAWLGTFPDHLHVPFIYGSPSTSYEAWLTFWTFIIILQVMVPLSLYVTIEVTKLIQAHHINNNIDLYDEETDKCTECRSLNITEQLGQIQYIFSDKTGTLTENKMVFRRCSISGTDYNHPCARATQGECLSMQLTPNPKLLEHLQELNSPQAEKIKEFLLALALCNTVVVAAHPHHDIMNSYGVIEANPDKQIPPDNQTDSSQYCRLVESRSITPSPTPEAHTFPFKPEFARLNSSRTIINPTLSPISSSGENSPIALPKSLPRPNLLSVPSMFFSKKSVKNDISPKTPSIPIFEAESPDELALVQMAFIYNCRLVKRTPSKAIVSLPGECIAEFDILKILPFDYIRKCMSVIIRKPATNEIIIYTKGADSSIFPKLVNPCSETTTENHIAQYSKQGLRVLALACRKISEDNWLKIKETIDRANGMPAAVMRDAYAVAECGLSLMGATGIEDRLQSGVPDTIKSLRAAGIVVWILTGDKIETASNVAVASGLLCPEDDLIKLIASSKHSAGVLIDVYKDEVINRRRDSKSKSLKAASRKAIIIDGKTLTFILSSRSDLTQPFLELTKHCSAVLCCRVTPLQKACIVKLVKEKLKMKTLAVGDGANDVSMIQAADVGIGISGQEGVQAVVASDFAIPKFKYLRNLLLVHGHWTYHRLSNMVLYFFYKNVTFVFLIFWYQLYCGFSGTVMIDQMYHMLYNLFFTSLPPLAIGVYDKDAPADLLFSRPLLYETGRLNRIYMPHSFWIVILDSIYQSLTIFFIAVAVYTGTEIGIWEFGSTITSSCLFTMLGQAAIETKCWNLLHVASLLISILLFYAFYIFYNNICMQCYGLSSNTWVMVTTVGDCSYYLIIILSTLTALLPKFIGVCLQNTLRPDDVMQAIIESKQAKKRGGNFLVSWSRSTSASSIYRTADLNKVTPTTPSTLTAVG